jgi:cell division protein FtsN
MPVGDEPAGARTTANDEDNISAASAEPAGSIAEQTRPAAEVVELARLEPADIAAPEPAGSEPLAEVVRPGRTGRWVINLASYTGPRTADRMQRKFEGLGVSTEKQVAEVNGKTMYRLRIASFESRADAKAYFETIKGALGLESAWITKK